MKKTLFYILGFWLIFANFAQAEQDLPSCNDSRLTTLVSSAIENLNKGSNRSPSSTRKLKLLAKYASEFVEVPISSFKPEDNYNVADYIISKRINDNYTEEDMRLCKSLYEQENDSLYTLIYREEDGIFVAVMNSKIVEDEQKTILKY